MKKTNIGFPYPVLSDDNNDYVDSHFRLIATEDAAIENGKIILKFYYDLQSFGLQQMIDNKQAEVLLYTESVESSFRKIFKFDDTAIEIEIEVALLTQKLTVKALIVAAGEYKEFVFDEHNKELFNSFGFDLHKGDILALSNIYEIPLDIVDPLANKPSVFSIRPDDNAVDSIRVDFWEDEHKINIWLKRDMHKLYQELREEPRFKMLLASYFVMPALIETLTFMKYDGASGDNEEVKSKGWFQSLEGRLAGLKIDLKTTDLSIATIANKILNDMVQVSMDNLKNIKDEIFNGNS